MHVSLGTNDTNDCSLALKAEELVVVVPDMTPITFKNVDVGVPEFNPANVLMRDVIAAEKVSMQCPGRVSGAVRTTLFLDKY